MSLLFLQLPLEAKTTEAKQSTGGHIPNLISALDLNVFADDPEATDLAALPLLGGAVTCYP